MKKIIELTDEQTLAFAKNHHWEENPIIDIDGTRGKNPVTYEEFAIKVIEGFVSSCISEQKKAEAVKDETPPVDIKLTDSVEVKR